MSFIDKFLKNFGAPDPKRYLLPINRLEFPREQMLDCLNAVYAKTVEDDLDLPPSLGSKLFEKALNEINIAITDSGLDHLPIPASSAAVNWTSLIAGTNRPVASC